LGQYSQYFSFRGDHYVLPSKEKEKVKEKGKTAELAIKSLETDDAYLLISILSTCLLTSITSSGHLLSR
jgi:hypothetical protein